MRTKAKPISSLAPFEEAVEEAENNASDIDTATSMEVQNSGSALLPPAFSSITTTNCTTTTAVYSLDKPSSILQSSLTLSDKTTSSLPLIPQLSPQLLKMNAGVLEGSSIHEGKHLPVLDFSASVMLPPVADDSSGSPEVASTGASIDSEEMEDEDDEEDEEEDEAEVVRLAFCCRKCSIHFFELNAWMLHCSNQRLW